MSFKTTISNIYSNVWSFGIIVSQSQAAPFLEGDKRVCCSINDTEAFQCALMSDGKGGFFINLNKERREALNLEDGEEVRITLTKDDSKYGMPLPEEMEELLLQDIEGADYFHALTKGKQRSLLYMVAKPKSVDIRLRKALVILDYLKTTKGKLDFQQLNQAFKLSNR